jgi:hypothetical protein
MRVVASIACISCVCAARSTPPYPLGTGSGVGMDLSVAGAAACRGRGLPPRAPDATRTTLLIYCCCYLYGRRPYLSLLPTAHAYNTCMHRRPIHSLYYLRYQLRLYYTGTLVRHVCMYSVLMHLSLATTSRRRPLPATACLLLPCCSSCWW